MTLKKKKNNRKYFKQTFGTSHRLEVQQDTNEIFVLLFSHSYHPFQKFFSRAMEVQDSHFCHQHGHEVNNCKTVFRSPVMWLEKKSEYSRIFIPFHSNPPHAHKKVFQIWEVDSAGFYSIISLIIVFTPLDHTLQVLDISPSEGSTLKGAGDPQLVIPTSSLLFTGETKIVQT